MISFVANLITYRLIEREKSSRVLPRPNVAAAAAKLIHFYTQIILVQYFNREPANQLDYAFECCADQWAKVGRSRQVRTYLHRRKEADRFLVVVVVVVVVG